MVVGMVKGGALAVVLAGVLLATTAHAQGTATTDRIGGWTVGALAFGSTPYTNTEAPERVSDLYDKVRIGGGSQVPGTAGLATVRPWVSLDQAGGERRMQGMSGVLIDVPFGSFTFTPSLGAGYLGRSALDGAPALEFRSQVELGYEFENKSRFTIGYSRITTPEENGRDPNNVFGLHYRLPFSAITGQ